MMVMAVAAAVVVGLVKMLIMFGQSCGCLFGMGGSHEMCHKTEPDDNLLWLTWNIFTAPTWSLTLYPQLTQNCLIIFSDGSEWTAREKKFNVQSKFSCFVSWIQVLFKHFQGTWIKHFQTFEVFIVTCKLNQFTRPHLSTSVRVRVRTWLHVTPLFFLPSSLPLHSVLSI